MSTTPADPWFQSLFADRIGGANFGKDSRIFKFEKIKRAKRAALAAHPERKLLDFGIGENDDMAPALVRETLKTEVDKLENRGYADNGIAAFKEAAAFFMRQVFGVRLDPEGYITTDKYQVTSVPHIYAIGDITGHAQLTPVATSATLGADDDAFYGDIVVDVAPRGDMRIPSVGPGARCRCSKCCNTPLRSPTPWTRRIARGSRTAI